MFAELTAIIAPILICSSIGYIWVRTSTPYPTEFITRLVMNIGAPCLVVSSLGQVDVDPHALLQVATATCIIMAILGAIGFIAARLLQLNMTTFLPPVLFPNTGNMGLPLCLFAFGETGLAMGIGIFIMGTVAQITIGMFIVSAGKGSLTDRLINLSKQPLLYSAIIAVAISLWIGLYPDGSITLLAYWLGFLFH